MKVIHICNAPLTRDHPEYGRLNTHPGRWVVNIAKALRRHCQIEAELLVQVPGSSQDWSAELETVPVHYVAAPDRLRSATFFQLDVSRLAKRVRSLRPDIAHAHGTEDAYALSAQRSGLPNVLTSQGLHFQLNRKLKAPLFSRARAVQFTEWLAFKRARHVIAKSEYVAHELKKRFPHLVLHSIPNTFDERLLEIQVPRQSNSLVYVGTVSPHKGVHTLREALLEVKRVISDVTLEVIGDWKKGAFPYEVEEKAGLSEILGAKVTFHGIVDVLRLGELVASAAALVAPSREDMFGNQVIEALLLGTPSIVAEGTALAENVRRFGHGLVVPQEDPAALADAIVRTLSETRSDSVAEKTRNAIIAALSPANVAQLHEKVYHELLSE